MDKTNLMFGVLLLWSIVSLSILIYINEQLLSQNNVGLTNQSPTNIDKGNSHSVNTMVKVQKDRQQRKTSENEQISRDGKSDTFHFE
jgi:hypothetical protein